MSDYVPVELNGSARFYELVCAAAFSGDTSELISFLSSWSQAKVDEANSINEKNAKQYREVLAEEFRSGLGRGGCGSNLLAELIVEGVTALESHISGAVYDIQADALETAAEWLDTYDSKENGRRSEAVRSLKNSGQVLECLILPDRDSILRSRIIRKK